MNISRNRQELIEEEIKTVKFRNSLYRMKLAQYEVEVNCTNKKEGRQFAAQKILKVSLSVSLICPLVQCLSQLSWFLANASTSSNMGFNVTFVWI